jgi:archaellum component FlaC
MGEHHRLTMKEEVAILRTEAKGAQKTMDEVKGLVERLDGKVATREDVKRVEEKVERVVQDLKALESTVEGLKPKAAQVDALAKDVEDLKAFKNKALGILALGSFLGAGGVAAIFAAFVK